jgi:predicted amidohydrolase
MKTCIYVLLLLSAAKLPLVGQAVAGNSGNLDFQFPFETYTQFFTVSFDDADACSNTEISIEPIFNGHSRAVSCRWDDNVEHDLPVKELLDEHGVKATWYLNSNTIFYLNDQDFVPTAAKLLENGHSIGGHGYSHPYIAYTNRNRMFLEAAKLRIEWESNLDTLLNSWAFSFINYRNPLEGPVSQKDIIKVLERAGFYHLSVFKTFDDQQSSDMIISIIMPPENQSFDEFKKAVDWAMNSEDIAKEYGCVSHSMHAWYDTPAVEYGLDELEKRVEYLNSFPDLWHCNQNQYAAYRYQYLNSQIEVVSRENKSLVFKLTRPNIIQLNNVAPLTVAVKTAMQGSVKSIKADEAAIYPSRAKNGRVLFNLPHTSGQRLPVLIGRIENPANRSSIRPEDQDPDFPGLKGILFFTGRRLTLRLENGTDKSLKDIKAIYRMPLAYKDGVAVKSLKDTAANLSLTDSYVPDLQTDDKKYTGGEQYFAAQLDFLHGEIPCRLYLTCSYEQPFDDTFPRDGFIKTQPIRPEAFNLDALAETLINRGGYPPAEIQLLNLPSAQWQCGQSQAPVPDYHFDPEVIPTQADWYASYSPVHVLYSQIDSEKDQWARAVFDTGSVQALFINGVRVEGFGVKLRQGLNHFVIVHSHENFTGSGEHAGCFMRLEDAEAGDRLQNIRFLRPDSVEKDKFAPSGAGPELREPFTIALLQMRAAGFDQQANLEKADSFCREAAARGADIAVFPEMFNIGYNSFHGLDKETIENWQARAVAKNGPWVQHFAKLAKELDMAIGVTYLEEFEPMPRNSITVFDRRGSEVLTYAKVHTCDFAAFEACTTPGDEWYVADLDTKNGTVRLGAMICFDREFPESARILMLKGAEVIITPNACILDDVRLAQFGTRALENSMVMAMTNYPDPGYGGRSAVYMIDGKQITEAANEDGVFTATVEMGWIREARKKTIWGDAFRRPHKYNKLTEPEKQDDYQRKNALGEPFVSGER